MLAFYYYYQCFFIAFTLFGSTVLAAPAFPVDRRADVGGPITIDMTQTEETANGAVTSDCTITLTPVTQSDGTVDMQEVTTCVAPSNGGDTASTSSSSTTVDATTSTSAAVATSTADTAAATTSTTAAAATSATDTAATATSTSDAVATSAADASTSSTDTTVASATSAADTAATSAADTAASATVAGAAASSAADTATSATSSAFTLPGTSLQVLPIGLGIFGGISAIALIVVALVTYERTKYRKAFRQKKLAEQGSSMGYGGMRSVA